MLFLNTIPGCGKRNYHLLRDAHIYRCSVAYWRGIPLCPGELYVPFMPVCPEHYDD